MNHFLKSGASRFHRTEANRPVFEPFFLSVLQDAWRIDSNDSTSLGAQPMGAVAEAGIDEEGEEPRVGAVGRAHRSPLRSAGSRPPWRRASTPGRPSCRRAGGR